jgi:hypothetical protein
VNTVAESHQQNASERGVPEDARKRFELLEDCREMVISRLSKVIGEALAKMGEELAGLAIKAKDTEEQRALMDAVSVVRQHRAEIELRFRRSFSDVFERRMFNKAPAAAAPQEPEELALVDDSVMQAKLAVDRLVHRARGQLDPDEVLGVRARLAALLERDWFEEGQHPASPEAIFEALKSSLKELAPKADVQAALLDAFEPHVSANLNIVYSSVNERLKANRVLPKIRAQVSVQRGGPTRPAGEKPEARAAAIDPRLRPGVAQTGGDPLAGGPLPTASEMQAILAQLANGNASARDTVTRMLSNPDTFAVADLPIPSVEPPVLDALSSLQASSLGATVVSPELIADLADRAREKGSPLDQLTVEIVSMVFDYIYADKRLADVVKQQLLRLQVVAIKAALIDRSFFARRQHPMRRLIDRISEVAADPDIDLSPGGQLVKGLEAVVEWVLLNFDQDLSTFDEARERIDGLAGDEAARRAERLAQLTRDAERTEAIAHARALARSRLADRVDPETPRFIDTFLDDWWTLALAHAQVAGPASAISFDEAMSIAEGLIWSVGPKFPEEVGKLAALLPKLINGLMRGVRLASMPEDARKAFFDELLKSHTRVIDGAKQLRLSGAGRKPSNLRMHSDGRIQFTPIVKAQVTALVQNEPAETRTSAIAALKRGDSIEIATDEAGTQFLAYKLSWVSPAQQVFVISRFPDAARSIARDQLCALFEHGRARLPEATSSVDRAIESIGPESRLSAPRDQPRVEHA